jgi:hypothetical protein
MDKILVDECRLERSEGGAMGMLRTKINGKLSVGDWVEVRSKEEILRTLDSKGQLDCMPFMPEMLEYCGKQFRIYKRAHKTCDYSTAFPFRTRRLKDTVHLETRCSGNAHGGCQAGCLLYWKHAWLRPIEPDSKNVDVAVGEISNGTAASERGGGDVGALLANTQATDRSGEGPVYVCQTTQIPFATTRLASWDIRQYIEDYWSGNVSLWRLLSGFIYSVYFQISQMGLGLGPAMRWMYNTARPVWGGALWPKTPGIIPEGESTPGETLNLQPGELVRVKPHAELVPYCGKTFRVLKRVTKLIDERTARMLEMKNPCIVLESVVCQARYSQCRVFCPKEMYPYWREIWLERITDEDAKTSRSDDHGVCSQPQEPPG